MVRSFCVAIVSCLTSLACLAVPQTHESTTTVSGIMISHGIYRAHGEGETSNAPDTAAGRTTLHDDFVHLETTTTVPLQRDVIFGFKYELRGLRPNSQDTISVRTIHPPIRGKDGKSSTVSNAVLDIEAYGGAWQDHLLYKLSTKDELVPGRWVLQVLYRGRVVLSKEFTVQ